jgi:FkbH-like protein
VSALAKPNASAGPAIKCLVWDLDSTVWDGVLVESDDVRLRPHVREVMQALDQRGILQSIASRNHESQALAKLEQFGLLDYFLCPRINWDPKSASLQAIAQQLNLSLDTFAFVDDQPFERDEVAYAHPQVLCLDAVDLARIPELPRFETRFATDDARLRRRMYQSDFQRNQAEQEFTGTPDEFLATLEMRFTIARATEVDLERAEELTVRTHQLNTTGYTYSHDELKSFIDSPRHSLLVCSLEDRYGAYGKIGLALVEREPGCWTLKLLLMSCRVMARGVGTILLNHIMHAAKSAGVVLRADFVSNDRNRMMYVTYKFAGFKEIGADGRVIKLQNDLAYVQDFPAHTRVVILGA